MTERTSPLIKEFLEERKLAHVCITTSTMPDTTSMPFKCSLNNEQIKLSLSDKSSVPFVSLHILLIFWSSWHTTQQRAV